MARRRIALLLLGLGVLGCGGGIPAPGFTTPFDKVSADSILAYLGELEFDYREGAGDVQNLPVGCPEDCRPGPRVGIFPERRTHQNREKDLTEGAGRIIATIINYDTLDYAPLRLGKGDTLYWAVDSVKPGDTVSRGRSMYLSLRELRERGPAVVARRPLLIEKHPGQEPLPMALARWIFDTTGYDTTGYEKPTPGGGSSEAPLPIWSAATWGNCDRGACCR